MQAKTAEGSTIWWVRHGPTHAKTMIGWSDLPADLSDHAALSRLATFLPAEVPVLSSDLLRAVSTADAIAGARLRLGPDPALREMHFGDWEHRAFAEIEAEDPAHIGAFWSEPGAVRPPGGESWNDLGTRVNAAVDDLVAGATDLIVVAHFGVILTQVQRATGEATTDVFAQRIDPLSVTEVRYGPTPSLGVVNYAP